MPRNGGSSEPSRGRNVASDESTRVSSHRDWRVHDEPHCAFTTHATVRHETTPLSRPWNTATSPRIVNCLLTSFATCARPKDSRKKESLTLAAHWNGAVSGLYSACALLAPCSALLSSTGLTCRIYQAAHRNSLVTEAICLDKRPIWRRRSTRREG